MWKLTYFLYFLQKGQGIADIIDYDHMYMK